MAKSRRRERDAKGLGLRALATSRVFRDLPETARDALAGFARIEAYAVPTLLQPAGERAKSLRFVLDGRIEFTARNAAGDDVTLGAVGPGGWATWLAVFDNAPPGHDFVSSHKARFVAFPAAEVRNAAQENPEVFPRIIREIGARFRNVLEWLEQSTILDRERRMAKLLVLLARVADHERKAVVVPMSQERLARLARCSRQSANVALKALAARGLVTVRYRRIEIARPEAIEAFAGGA